MERKPRNLNSNAPLREKGDLGSWVAEPDMDPSIVRHRAEVAHLEGAVVDDAAKMGLKKALRRRRDTPKR